jgi:hypothetical protein
MPFAIVERRSSYSRRAANLASVGKTTVATATEKIPGEHVDPEGLVDRRRRSSETRVPKKLLMIRLKLISPRLRVTGSINRSTLRTSGIFQSSFRTGLKGVLRRSNAGIASWTAVPTRRRSRTRRSGRHLEGGRERTSTVMIATFQKNGEIAKAAKRS